MKKRILSILIAGAMMLGVLPALTPELHSLEELESLENPESLAIPEILQRDANQTRNHTERRYELETDLNTVAFANAGGTNTLYLFNEPVKYIADDGTAKDKSNRLYSEADSGFVAERGGKNYAFANLDNDIRTYFPARLDGETGILLSAKGVQIELSPVIAKAANSAKAEQRSIPASAAGVDDWVYYDGLFGDGTALRYTPIFSGFKEDIVLYRNVGNTFRFTLNPNGLTPVLDNGYIKLLQPKTGEVAAEISPIFVYDSAETTPNVTIDNSIKFTPLEGGNYELLVEVDEKFLSSPDTVYPVYVDPTVTVTTSGSGAGKTIQDLPFFRNGLQSNLSSHFFGITGTDLGPSPGRMLMRFPGVLNHAALQGLPAANITNATLHMRQFISMGSNVVELGAYQYSGNANWTECPSAVAPEWNGIGVGIDYTYVGPSSLEFSFNITQAVRNWKNNAALASRGLLLRSEDENNSMKFVFTTRTTTAPPYVSVEYVQQHTVTFNANGGNALSPSTRVVNHNNAIGSLPVPTRANYNFVGWFSTTTEGSGVERFATTVVAGNMMIYARWTPFEFDKSGGTVTITGHKNPNVSGSLTIPATIGNVPVTRIGINAFSYKGAITSVTIPNGVTTIGNGAFVGCAALTAITIPNSVRSIGSFAFQNCINLTSVVLPNGMTSISNGVFSGCSKLASITMPNTIKSIMTGAFADCVALTSIIIPNGVTTIGATAFFGCTSLTSITIPSSVIIIDNLAFTGCTALTSAMISNGVTKIEMSAFASTGITSITIPGSVEEIGVAAFSFCTSLTSVSFMGSIPPDFQRDSNMDIFFGSIGITQIKVPANSVNAYKAALYANGVLNAYSIVIPL